MLTSARVLSITLLVCASASPVVRRVEKAAQRKPADDMVKPAEVKPHDVGIVRRTEKPEPVTEEKPVVRRVSERSEQAPVVRRAEKSTPRAENVVKPTVQHTEDDKKPVVRRVDKSSPTMVKLLPRCRRASAWRRMITRTEIF